MASNSKLNKQSSNGYWLHPKGWSATGVGVCGLPSTLLVTHEQRTFLQINEELRKGAGRGSRRAALSWSLLWRAKEVTSQIVYTPPIPTQFLTSPLGILKIESNGTHIASVSFAQKYKKDDPDALTQKCAQELCDYLLRGKRTFSVPLLPSGTPFQQSVWKAMQKIPYGETMSYAEIASAIKRPKAVRAVGTACGANPIVILIPCHRVVGSKGLGGYSGGIQKKEWLLARESKV